MPKTERRMDWIVAIARCEHCVSGESKYKQHGGVYSHKSMSNPRQPFAADGRRGRAQLMIEEDLTWDVAHHVTRKFIQSWANAPRAPATPITHHLILPSGLSSQRRLGPRSALSCMSREIHLLHLSITNKVTYSPAKRRAPHQISPPHSGSALAPPPFPNRPWDIYPNRSPF
jgi:hypothetical protein